MTKKEQYELSLSEIQMTLSGERDLIANLGNTSAVLNEYMEDINWVGFYLYKNDELILGPFQGRAACVRIKIGKGVCGTAFLNNEATVVPDVHLFPGHIACDCRSRSEIVIPLNVNGKEVGVLDIDSPSLERFTEEDKGCLLKIAEIVEKSCDWDIF